MGNELIVPKKKRAHDRDKVTLYIDRKVVELYKLGSDNGWETSEIARKAVEKAIVECESVLRQKVEK